MGRSFVEYAEAEALVKKHNTQEYFDAHPDLLEEVIRIRGEGWRWTDIHAWLRDDHDLSAASGTPIRIHLEKLGHL